MSTLAEGTYTIVNLWTNTCLQAGNAGDTTDAILVCNSALPDLSQQWYVRYDAVKAAYVLQNVVSDLYVSSKQTLPAALPVPYSVPASGTKIYQTDTAPDYFNIVTGTASGAYFIFQTADPTILLDLSSGASANYTPVIFNTQTSPLTNTANQQWRFALSTGVPTNAGGALKCPSPPVNSAPVYSPPSAPFGASASSAPSASSSAA